MTKQELFKSFFKTNFMNKELSKNECIRSTIVDIGGEKYLYVLQVKQFLDSYQIMTMNGKKSTNETRNQVRTNTLYRFDEAFQMVVPIVQTEWYYDIFANERTNHQSVLYESFLENIIVDKKQDYFKPLEFLINCGKQSLREYGDTCFSCDFGYSDDEDIMKASKLPKQEELEKLGFTISKNYTYIGCELDEDKKYSNLDKELLKPNIDGTSTFIQNPVQDDGYNQ